MYRIYLINGHKVLESQPENILVVFMKFLWFYIAKRFGYSFEIIDQYGFRIVILGNFIANCEIAAEKIVAER